MEPKITFQTENIELTQAQKIHIQLILNKVVTFSEDELRATIFTLISIPLFAKRLNKLSAIRPETKA